MNDDNYLGSSFDSDSIASINALILLDMYKKACQEFTEVEIKRDLYAKEYLELMSHNNVPIPQLGYHFIDRLEAPELKKDKSGKKHRANLIKELIESLFDKEFIDKYLIDYIGQTSGGYEGYFHILKFRIGDYIYYLQCPHPENMPKKRFSGQNAPIYDTMYRADCVLAYKADAFCVESSNVHKPTFNWRDCVKAIQEHVVQCDLGDKTAQL